MVKREKAFKETKRIVGTGSLMIESPGKPNECSNCNKNVNTYSFRFTQCKVVNYCSKKCQQTYWIDTTSYIALLERGHSESVMQEGFFMNNLIEKVQLKVENRVGGNRFMQ